MNILIVEDELVISKGIQMILQSQHHKVKLFTDAESALQQIRKGECGLAIIDYILPKIDGISLIRMFRTKCPDLPVILISGFDTAETVVAGVNAGVFDYLPKPFTRQELISRVNRAIQFTTYQKKSWEKRVDKRFFGCFSWVRTDRNDAVIGVDPIYIATIPAIKIIKGPIKGKNIYQGSVFADIITNTGVSFPVWSPVTGQVIECLIPHEGSPTNANMHSSVSIARVHLKNFDKDSRNLNSGKGACS